MTDTDAGQAFLEALTAAAPAAAAALSSSAPAADAGEGEVLVEQTFTLPTAEEVRAAIPTFKVRERSASWLDPSQWTTADLVDAWATAQGKAPLVVMFPSKYQTAVDSLMVAVAQINVALDGLPQSAERTAMARELRELASGLYGLAELPDGSPVTSYDPAVLAGVTAYVFEVNGVEFDAIAAAFAAEVSGLAATLLAKALALKGDVERESRGTRRIAYSARKLGTVGAVLVVGGLAAGALWFLRRKR